MYYTTGLTQHQFDILCDMIEPDDPAPQKPRGKKQSLSFSQKIEVAVTYIKTNRTEHDLAYTFSTSQATISRVICTYTPAVCQALAHLIPTVEDLDPEEQLIIDGTLAPNWSWRAHPEDWSGKHNTTGMNLQVAVSLTGDLRWVSDPLPGSTHDTQALRSHGLLDIDNPPPHIGDKGYQGVLAITPIKKNPGEEQLDPKDQQFNESLSSIRSVIERAIANLKIWRTMHTDFRRPRTTHAETITTIIGLYFLRTHYE